jgi:hypothetical protein
MAQLVTSGAALSCSMGLAPSTLTVTPEKMVTAGAPAATIQDMKPMINIPPFGMCNTESNPTVAAATASASGVHTPAPCVPSVVGPWSPGAATVLIKNVPALDNTSTCQCMWGGVISINSAGQFTVTVP